jgi:hypothetical protein
MKTSKNTSSTGLTRREMLKLSGLAVGGLAFGGAMIGPSANNALAQDNTCDCADVCDLEKVGCK